MVTFQKNQQLEVKHLLVLIGVHREPSNQNLHFFFNIISFILILNFRSCRPDKREYSNKSIEKSKHRHHHNNNDENKKKSIEDKLSDLNATESINFS